MKRLLILIVTVFCVQTNAQVISIPDQNFEQYLIFNNHDTDGIVNGQISVADALAVTSIYTIQHTVSDFSGLEHFTNLIVFNSVGDNFTSLDLTNFTSLAHIIIEGNNAVTSITINHLPALYSFILDDLFVLNDLNILNINHIQVIELKHLNAFQHLNLSEVTSGRLDLDFLTAVETVNIKNGQVFQIQNELNGLTFHPNILQQFCVDAGEIGYIQNKLTPFPNVTITPYCSFMPTGQNSTNQIIPKLYYDVNQDNCMSSPLEINDGIFKIEDTNTMNSRYYSINPIIQNPIYVFDGNYDVQLGNYSFFNVSQNINSLDFPTDPSPANVDFCLTNPVGVHPNLELSVVLLGEQRPGLNLIYEIILKNTGNQEHNVNLNFNFEQTMQFGTASGNSTRLGNNVSWATQNINPFETIRETVGFTLNTPMDNPPLNDGDDIQVTTTVDDISSNNFDLNNTLITNIVNSYDPNDKTCLQGSVVDQSLIGEYVDYLIRFENLGSANAINVVVRDIIDTNKFDVSSIKAINSNYNFRTEIINGNEVEFIFENINLPPSPPSNRVIGYVAFKIKTLNSLTLGDTFTNQANIFFDFNFPITTNNFETAIDTVLNSAENNYENQTIELFPNPAKDLVKIKSKQAIQKILFFDVNGRLVQTLINPNQEIDVSRLAQGIYTVKVVSKENQVTKKLIKQ